MKQLYIDSKSGNHGPNEVDHEESWFHDINDLTLQKLSGLRNYKEKWEDTKNKIITVDKINYIKLVRSNYSLQFLAKNILSEARILNFWKTASSKNFLT